MGIFGRANLSCGIAPVAPDLEPVSFSLLEDNSAERIRSDLEQTEKQQMKDLAFAERHWHRRLFVFSTAL